LFGPICRHHSSSRRNVAGYPYGSHRTHPLTLKHSGDDFTHRPPARLARLIEFLNKVKPDLLTAWIASHVLFAAAMSLAPFAASFRFATALVAICGLPWTIAMWAPTTFLGVEVNKLSGGAADGSSTSYRRLSNVSAIEMRPPRHDQAQPHGSAAAAVDDELGPSALPPPSTGELSGVYFGILNIYTTIPQFISTFISTIVFAVLEPGKSPELATDAHPSEHHGTDGPNAIAVCLFIGAVSALGAAWATSRLRTM
jgi:solute carrier family 45, member 1/2/4